ncbi:unnamed protein product [Staurois parvus]|uniref:Uncharacterized protein n=1 Tax=Staurois parvus TaxID=386267 RepID=A0ABN9FER3_9NEOB|nr:unnamed protein product [Staurois parvus]
MQSGKYLSPGNCQTQTRLHCSRVSGDVLYTTASDALHCTWCTWWLSCCCSQLLPLYYNPTNS